MNLFNKRSLIHMLRQSAYEKYLNSAQFIFLNLAGHVRLRTDRYLYDGKPVVQFDGDDDLILVSFYLPDFDKVELSDDEGEDQPDNPYALIKTHKIVPGQSCADFMREVVEHLNLINEKHVIKLDQENKFIVSA